MDGWISEPLMTNNNNGERVRSLAHPKRNFNLISIRNGNGKACQVWINGIVIHNIRALMDHAVQANSHSSIVGQPNDGCDQQQFRISIIIISGHILSISTKWVFSKKVMHVWPDFLQEISWQWLYPWPGRAGHMDSSQPSNHPLEKHAYASCFLFLF